MPLRPWHEVYTPREDLREGKPLDASEFADNRDTFGNGVATFGTPGQPTVTSFATDL